MKMFNDFCSAMRFTSRQARRHGCDEFLKVLIQSGVKFDLADGQLISRFYSEAVIAKNASAYKAIEAHLGRKPFISKPSAIRHYREIRNPPRLIIGAWFTWEGEPVKVTSFDDKAGTITACSYTNLRLATKQIKRRLILTPADLKEGERKHTEHVQLKSRVDQLESEKRRIARLVATELGA